MGTGTECEGADGGVVSAGRILRNIRSPFGLASICMRCDGVGERQGQTLHSLHFPKTPLGRSYRMPAC